MRVCKCYVSCKALPRPPATSEYQLCLTMVDRSRTGRVGMTLYQWKRIKHSYERSGIVLDLRSRRHCVASGTVSCSTDML